MTDGSSIGRRVACWRERRGMSRRQFADLVGRSLSWAEKVEAGTRDLVRLPMLQRVAAVLQVDLATLLDRAQAEHASQVPDAAEVAALKRALGRRHQTRSRQAAADVDVGQLRRQVGYVNSAWLASDFSVLGRTLPAVLDDCQHAAETLTGKERRQAAALLVITYKIASSVFHKFGSAELAWLAADPAFTAAQDADDPVTLARATRCVARALVADGQAREAVHLTEAVAAQLEAALALERASPELISLFGMMLLAAEIAAAQEGDAGLATALHRRAADAAGRLVPGYEDPDTAFGATNVALHRLSALIRLGDSTEAIKHAEAITPAALQRLPRERKASYLLDLAEAHRQIGH